MTRTIVISAAAIALLAGCSSTTEQLSYTGANTTHRPAGGPPAVAEVRSIDKRGEADPTWFGAIRGGYGNPLKVLHTADPVSEVVATAVRQALASRNLLASGNGKFDVVITIAQFQSDQVVRREADVDLIFEIVERNTNRQVYRDEAKVELVTGSILTFDTGILAAPDDLRKTAETALNKAIDQALDRPEFAAALRT